MREFLEIETKIYGRRNGTITDNSNFNVIYSYISGMNYAIRSSLYLLLIILDNIVSSNVGLIRSIAIQFTVIDELPCRG